MCVIVCVGASCIARGIIVTKTPFGGASWCVVEPEGPTLHCSVKAVSRVDGFTCSMVVGGDHVGSRGHVYQDPGFGKGGFMRMCTVATTPPFNAHVHRCNESGGCCFNGRETVSFFSNYTSSKGVSMETPLDLPLPWHIYE